MRSNVVHVPPGTIDGPKMMPEPASQAALTEGTTDVDQVAGLQTNLAESTDDDPSGLGAVEHESIGALI